MEKLTATKNGNSEKVNYLIHGVFILILLSSAHFFRIKYLSQDMLQVIQIAAIGLMFAFIVFQEIYWKTSTLKHHFTIPILIIFTGVLLSMFTAYTEHGQPFQISMWAQRFMYFYLLYFLLHIIRIPVKQMENILFYIGVVYALAFLIQYVIYPRTLFDVRMGMERGTIRIFIPGLPFLNLAYFICLNKIFVNQSYLKTGWLILFLSVFILSGTRSILAGPLLVTLMALAFSKGVRSRSVITGLVIIGAGLVYYMFQDIIQNLINISEAQSMHSSQNIRLRAAEFFLTDFFPNKLAYITGNGESHQASQFGREISYYKAYHGFYQSDIGIIGEYSKYGLLLIIGAASLLIKGISSKIPSLFLYTKYFLILTIIFMPFGVSYTSSDSIAVICCALYIIDNQKNKLQTNNKTIKRPVVYFEELEKDR